MSHVIGRVIVGVHGTPGSLDALRFALGHARAFDATLVPVIAWEPPGGDTAGLRLPPYLARELAKTAKSTLLTAFEEGLGGLPDDVPVRGLAVRGQVGRVLVAVADHESDLLVVGAGDHGRLHRACYGSPSRYCLAHARCAVIVVPPNPLARELRKAGKGLRWRRLAGVGVSVPHGLRTGT